MTSSITHPLTRPDCDNENILQIENVFNQAAPYFSVSNPLFQQDKVLNRIRAVILIALFFNVKGKGLVVLSGCAHVGIVNAVKHAQKVSGTDKIHAVMGRFRLINAKPEVIQNTVADIKAMKPDYIVPTHCTGFEAIVSFSREMPNEFIINTAGTKYTFGA